MLLLLLVLAMLPTLVSAVSNAISREPQPLPGLTARESADFLWLDWLLSVGLYDLGLARRYVAQPGCRRCTWPDGSPLPLEWRVPI